ncbi:MAG: hypothetical protein ACI80P_000309, partial [Flavobacteriales bacterium]
LCASIFGFIICAFCAIKIQGFINLALLSD